MSLWTYKAEVVRWVDADTVDLKVDLGFGIFKTDRFRLSGINAWETRGEEREKGLAAKEFCIALLPEGSGCVIETVRDSKGKYGRYLAEIYSMVVPTEDQTSLNVMLVEAGHARYQEY